MFGANLIGRTGSCFMKTIVLTEYFLPIRGGSIVWLINAYKGMADAVMFVVGQQDFAAEKFNFSQLTRKIDMSMVDWDPSLPSSMKKYFQACWKLIKICKEHQAQQIHCAKVLPEGFLALFVYFFTSIPFVLYAHGEEITVGITSRKFRFLLPFIYNRARAIIANSHNTKELLLSIGVRHEKIHIIRPGVDIDRYFPVENKSSEILERHKINGPILLTVGRLQRRKGQDMVIKSLPFIIKSYPSLKYIIVGEGEELANLRELVDFYKVQKNVIFAGKVSDSDLVKYYQSCDIFIMPNRQIGSDIEGFGMVFLEANAVQKPVIGGKSGGTGDAIIEGKTGFRVNGEIIEEISDAVLKLLADPVLAKQMGSHGRQRVEQEFSWAAVAEQTLGIANAI